MENHIDDKSDRPVRSFRLTQRAAGVAAAAALVVGLAGWAFAEGEVPLLSSSSSDTPSSTSSTTTVPTTPGANTDNAAVAVNKTDGRNVFALSLKIVHTDAPVVDAQNAAVAVASCSDCQTVAIALEGVLVVGDPTTFDPTNIALAINTDCTNCQTLATAYQNVVQYDTKVRITGAGRQEIAAIRKDLNSLRNSGLDILAIQKRVNEDAGRFLAVLQNQVVPVGKPGPSTTTTTAAPAATNNATTTTTAAPTTTSTPTTVVVETTTSTTTSTIAPAP